MSYVEAGSDVEVNGGQYYARLTVFLVNGRAQSVLALATDSAVFKTYAGQVTPFFASFRSAAQAGSGSRDIGAFRGKGIAGVWMTFITMIGSYEPTPRWMTLFTDGQIYDDIPREGLDSFDRAVSKSDKEQAGYWGTYAWNGSSGSIAMPRMTKPWPLAAETPTKITVGNSIYVKCPEVDGLRLEGSWTSYADPADPSLAALPAGQKPVISFTKDGRFNDQGLFLAFLHGSYTDKSAEGPGSGTYEVRNYTLVLSYSDGRAKTAAISGLLGANPATNSQYLYVERTRLTRMK